MIFAHSLHPPPPLHHHSCPRSHPRGLQRHPNTCHEPLPSVEGCGLDFHRHCSLRSEDATPGAPPLYKGMWAIRSCSTGDPGRQEDEGDPWGGMPWWRVAKRSTTLVVVHVCDPSTMRRKGRTRGRRGEMRKRRIRRQRNQQNH